jgi:hypothetical protein
MSKKGETHFDYMPMFSLHQTILVVCMWTGDTMHYVNAFEEGVKDLIFSSPVCLYGSNFLIELAFNQVLKLLKALEDI